MVNEPPRVDRLRKASVGQPWADLGFAFSEKDINSFVCERTGQTVWPTTSNAPDIVSGQVITNAATIKLIHRSVLFAEGDTQISPGLRAEGFAKARYPGYQNPTTIPEGDA